MNGSSRNFKELEASMQPESLARAKTRAKEMMAEMLLSEIRREVGLTQEELAASLGIKQPSLSRLESQDDTQNRTLRRFYVPSYTSVGQTTWRASSRS